MLIGIMGAMLVYSPITMCMFSYDVHGQPWLFAVSGLASGEKHALSYFFQTLNQHAQVLPALTRLCCRPARHIYLTYTARIRTH